jgi:hypothetical protein
VLVVVVVVIGVEDSASVSVSEEASSSQESATDCFFEEVDWGFAKAGEDLEGVGWMERLCREDARSKGGKLVRVVLWR